MAEKENIVIEGIHIPNEIWDKLLECQGLINKEHRQRVRGVEHNEDPVTQQQLRTTVIPSMHKMVFTLMTGKAVNEDESLSAQIRPVLADAGQKAIWYAIFDRVLEVSTGKEPGHYGMRK